MPRRREIAVLQLAQKIEAVLATGAYEDVEMSDGQLTRVADLLRQSTGAPAIAPSAAQARWPSAESAGIHPALAPRALRATTRLHPHHLSPL